MTLKVTTTKPTRGGYQPKKKIKSGQTILIDYLIKSYGGPAGMAKILGVHVQTPINWRQQGSIPLKVLGEVADKLGVSPWALNYAALRSIFLNSSPSWTDTVYSLTELSYEEILKVLKGTKPYSD